MGSVADGRRAGDPGWELSFLPSVAPSEIGSVCACSSVDDDENVAGCPADKGQNQNVG